MARRTPETTITVETRPTVHSEFFLSKASFISSCAFLESLVNSFQQASCTSHWSIWFSILLPFLLAILKSYFFSTCDFLLCIVPFLHKGLRSTGCNKTIRQFELLKVLWFYFQEWNIFLFEYFFRSVLFSAQDTSLLSALAIIQEIFKKYSEWQVGRIQLFLGMSLTPSGPVCLYLRKIK